jgi:hypothetical protein
VEELSKYKQINMKLQKRVSDLLEQLKNIQDGDDQKINKLEKVKKDTIDKIQELKNIQNANIEFNNNIKGIIKNNISRFENTEETILICSETTTLPSTINNVTSIELSDFDLPFDKFNINNNNNNLRFNINDFLNATNKQSDPSNNQVISNENSDPSNEQVNIEEDGNNIIVKVIIGNYTIDDIITILNNALSKYDLNLTYSKNNIITIKSQHKFDLVFESKTLFYNLGFIDESKYNGSNKYSGTKFFEFKVGRYMNIYLTNLNKDKPVMRYIINQQDKTQTKKIQFVPIISELNEIVIKFTDAKDKEFNFDPDNGFDFGIRLTIRYINSNQNYIQNESNDDISSDDILTLVKKSL